jgi:hypothetical protein
MQFSKISSIAVLFFLSLLSFVVANPIEARADNADIQTVLTTLKTKLERPIADISKAVHSFSSTIVNVVRRVHRGTVEPDF